MPLNLNLSDALLTIRHYRFGEEDCRGKLPFSPRRNYLLSSWFITGDGLSGLHAATVTGLFGILHREFIFLPPFIYLFIYAIIYFCADAWIFYTLHYNPILFIFCSNFSSSAIGVLSGGPCVLLTWPPPHIILGFLFFGTPFLFGTVRCSRFLWYIPCPSPWSSHLSKVA